MFYKNLIKVGGQHYTVDLIEGLTDCGSIDLSSNKILINKNQSDSNKESALLHEILEAINSIYDLNLEHQTLQTLEAALYQVYTDNFK